MRYYEELTAVEEAKLNAVMDAAVPVMQWLYKPNCCIAATRVLLDVFAALKVKARPAMVRCTVVNPRFLALGGFDAWEGLPDEEAAQRWAEQGAWMIEMGVPHVPCAPLEWSGHLVCIAFGKILIDLALPQANRPEKDIRLDPLCLQVDKEWLRREIAWGTDLSGCQVWYALLQDDGGYAKARDWIDPLRRQRAVRLILRGVRIDSRW